MKPKGNESLVTLPTAVSSRRRFLRGMAVGSLGAVLGCKAFRTTPTTRMQTERVFHLSIAIEAFEADPDLIPTLSRAGVSHIWLAPFFSG